MTSLLPAVLPRDFSDLEEKLGLVAGRATSVHIDVMNGTLTPDSSWPYLGEEREFLKIVDEVEGFPFWDEMSFEAHLMVKNPEEIAEDWIRAGAERIIIQFEAFENEEDFSRSLNALKSRFNASDSLLGVEVGAGFNLDTPLDKIYPYVPEADFVHLMSIASIGKQGNAFESKIFDRIEELKRKFPKTIISVDGGINLSNAEDLIEAGADRLIVGSAIFASESPEESLDEFLEIAN